MLPVSFGLVVLVTLKILARATDVLGTVANTSWLAPNPEMTDELNTPLRVTLVSARRSKRSIADLLIPVVSWTPLGVVREKLVMSSELEPEST